MTSQLSSDRCTSFVAMYVVAAVTTLNVYVSSHCIDAAHPDPPQQNGPLIRSSTVAVCPAATVEPA